MLLVRNIGALAPLDVKDTRVFNCARKPVSQVELSGLIVCSLVFCFHSASIWIVSRIPMERNRSLPNGTSRLGLPDCHPVSGRELNQIPISDWCDQGFIHLVDYACAAIFEYGDCLINFFELVTQRFSHFRFLDSRARKQHCTLEMARTVERMESARCCLDADHVSRSLADRKSTRMNSSHANISYAVF